MVSPEIVEQGRCLSKMCGDEMNLIAEHAEEFREIINGFKKELGRIPTAEEILWIVCEHAGKDLTKEK